MRKAVLKKVKYQVPVRADIAGAFSDVAYYLDKYGIEKGLVSNSSLPIYIKISAAIDEEDAAMTIKLPDLEQEIEGDIRDLKKQDNHNVSQIIIQFINLFNLDTAGLKIVVDGEGKIPPASGLGTSSAVGVGVIMALSKLYDLHGINPCELNYITELSMGIMGGKQDYYAAWLTGLNLLEFFGPSKSLVGIKDHLEENSKQHRWFLSNSLIYFSGQSRSSGFANAEPERKVRSDPDIINRIAKVAGDSWHALKNMDEKRLANAINKDRNNRLELSKLYYTQKMEEMGKEAESLGYAHRACGAGNGGCMLFFGDPKNHQKLEHALNLIDGYRVC